MFLHSKLPLDLLWEQNWWKSFFGDPKIFGISKNCFGGQNELAIYDFVKGWGISQPQTFQPQASTPNHSTSDFSTPWFKNSWLKSPGLKSSWLNCLGLKSPGLKLEIEKSWVDMSFNHLYCMLATPHVHKIVVLSNLQGRKFENEAHLSIGHHHQNGPKSYSTVLS